MSHWSSCVARSPEASTSTVAPPGPASALPELAAVPWRPRASTASLRRMGHLWTLSTLSQSVPFAITAVVLALLNPVTIPVGVILLAHAWIIPELYAARGANVVRRRGVAVDAAETRAVGLLGDLVGHEARDLHRETGLVLERGDFGVWLVGEAGALLLRPGGGRVHCYCVKATDAELPAADRIAHLLLALRADESGFATVANLAYSGARWRLRRRVPAPAREALERAALIARASPTA